MSNAATLPHNAIGSPRDAMQTARESPGPANTGNAKVSVAMITFNQERFVAQTIESVLRQETDFPVELVIGDDFSQDGTRRIVTEYRDRHSDRIRLLPGGHNVGMLRNFVQTIEACTGQYIALLEGDDFWTSPRKLQKQVDFLDARPDLSCCAHNAVKIDQITETEVGHYCPPHLSPVLKVRDMLRCDWVPTCSVMFRRRVLGPFPDWYFDLLMGDWSLHLLNMRFGDMGYDQTPMAAYRIHADGVWSGATPVQRIMSQIEAHHRFDALFDRKHRRLIRRILSGRYYDLALEQMRLGQLAGARQSFYRMLRYCPFNRDLRLRNVVKTAVKLFAPAVYRAAISMDLVERAT
jgi:glycosyltransferase involved in cell wall biosynthesis